MLYYHDRFAYDKKKMDFKIMIGVQKVFDARLAQDAREKKQEKEQWKKAAALREHGALATLEEPRSPAAMRKMRLQLLEDCMLGRTKAAPQEPRNSTTSYSKTLQ